LSWIFKFILFNLNCYLCILILTLSFLNNYFIDDNFSYYFNSSFYIYHLLFFFLLFSPLFYIKTSSFNLLFLVTTTMMDTYWYTSWCLTLLNGFDGICILYLCLNILRFRVTSSNSFSFIKLMCSPIMNLFNHNYIL
jgi:hypothetical protein